MTRISMRSLSADEKAVWAATHKDFRSVIDANPFIMELDHTTGATVLVPLEQSRLVRTGSWKLREFKRIVESGDSAKIAGFRVDLFSASVVIKVHEALSDENKEKLLSLDTVRIVSVALKLAEKHGSFK